MYAINRDIVVIKGRQALVDWINSHNPEHPVSLADVCEDCTVLLIPEYDDSEEAMSLVEGNYELLFMSEIENWYVDDALWPKDITLEKFHEWFEIEYHSMILDVLDEDIEKDMEL